MTDFQPKEQHFAVGLLKFGAFTGIVLGAFGAGTFVGPLAEDEANVQESSQTEDESDFESEALSPRRVAPAERTTSQPFVGQVVTFSGACDASGAVPLEGNRFAVADDEDNLIRIYDAAGGGAPLGVTALGVVERMDAEMDLEAATRIGDFALWLASHSRNKKGKFRPTRLNMFLTNAPDQHSPLRLLGTPTQTLLSALTGSPMLAGFRLDEAAKLAPNVEGGLNIEGMTARRNGGVVIGLRSPVPGGRALVIGISNPLEVARGQATPHVDSTHLLDLGENRGIRGLSEWRGRYLIIGGSPTYTTVSKLFTWDGVSADVQEVDVDLDDYNPEAFYTPEDQELIMLVSDDGHVKHGEVACKHLADAKVKQFRGVWLEL